MTIIKSVILPAFFKNTANDSKYFIDILKKVRYENLYDAVEFYFEGSEDERQEIRDALLETGLQSVFLAGIGLKNHKLNLCDIDDDKRNHAIDIVKGWVDHAYFYGSKKMLVLSGKNYTDVNERQRAMENFKSSLEEVCKYAELKARDYVLSVTLEYFNDKGDPFFLVGPSNEAKEIAEYMALRCSNFELTFDLSHAIQLNEDPLESFNSIKKYVNHIHIANCVVKDRMSIFFGDKHPPIGIDGGEVYYNDVKSFLKAVQSSGHFCKKETVLGIEIITPQGMDAVEVYESSTKIFKAAADSLSLI